MRQHSPGRTKDGLCVSLPIVSLGWGLAPGIWDLELYQGMWSFWSGQRFPLHNCPLAMCAGRECCLPGRKENMEPFGSKVSKLVITSAQLFLIHWRVSRCPPGEQYVLQRGELQKATFSLGRSKIKTQQALYMNFHQKEKKKIQVEIRERKQKE